ncbi:MAG: PrsW family glutamic-type intramembrane protease [Anaerolineales bacterium]
MIQPAAPEPVTAPPTDRETHWPSILAAGGGILAFVTLFGAVGFFIFSGIMAVGNPIAVDNGQPGMLFSYAAATALISLLVGPTVVLAVRRLAGKPPARGILAVQLKAQHAGLLLLIYLLVLASGQFITQFPKLDWLTMPALNVLALSLPVILYLWLGTRDLPPSSPQRNWTIFGLGIVVNPLVIMVTELMVIFIGLILIIVFLAVTTPDFPARLQEFSLLMETAQTTMQFPQDELIGLLQSPIVIGALLVFTAGLVPLVEEAIKPAGVWLLSGRELTPRDGWVLGLLSGAGFALVENLGNLAVGEGWAPLAIARAGATALHMFNTAIIGYTFVLSRRQKRWRGAILAFTGTLLLHALWNSVAVIATVTSLSDLSANAGGPLGYLLILGLASIGTSWGIYRVNRKLAAEPVAESEISLESEKLLNDRPDHAIG